MAQDKARELEHARKILHNPEFYWNSATSAGNRGSVRRAKWVLEAARVAPGQHVLEVGSGTGFFSQIFLESVPGIRLDAIELSPELAAKAVERCGDRARFHVGDIEATPYPDRHFDAVVGIRVLHHLDLSAAFQEILRVLKKGGRIAFCEPNMLNPQIMLQKNVPWIKRLMGDTPDETAFFKWPLGRFLRDRGFDEVRIEPFDFLHPWIPEPVVPLVERVGARLEKMPLLREIAGSLRISARKV